MEIALVGRIKECDRTHCTFTLREIDFDRSKGISPISSSYQKCGYILDQEKTVLSAFDSGVEVLVRGRLEAYNGEFPIFAVSGINFF